MDKPTTCHYCTLAAARIVDESALSIAFKDAFPISPGHTLIIPRRHTDSFFDLTQQEREDMLDLLTRVKNHLQDELNPQGFNVGFNEGFAAGQTVMHTNIQLIPRFKGDVAEPRGGIRWLFPEKAVFWDKKPEEAAPDIGNTKPAQ
jgi:diadenosine tetraphosphate (Ap4A) HIT family hydrolase